GETKTRRRLDIPPLTQPPKGGASCCWADNSSLRVTRSRGSTASGGPSSFGRKPASSSRRLTAGAPLYALLRKAANSLSLILRYIPIPPTPAHALSRYASQRLRRR